MIQYVQLNHTNECGTANVRLRSRNIKTKKKRKLNPLKPLVKILTVLSACDDGACFSWLWQPNYFDVNAPQGAPPLMSLGPLHARDVPYEDCRTQEQIVLCVNFSGCRERRREMREGIDCIKKIIIFENKYLNSNFLFMGIQKWRLTTNGRALGWLYL